MSTSTLTARTQQIVGVTNGRQRLGRIAQVPRRILSEEVFNIQYVWNAFAKVEWGDEDEVFPISVLTETYSSEEMIADVDRLNTIIDLSDGLFSEADVLAAFEWHRTVLPSVIGNYKYGSFFAIDYRRLTQESWADDERFMVIRGVNRIRTSVPIWFLQGEGQRVDEWKGMGVNPVFTQYVPGQWDWMMELYDAPTWPAEFQKDSKLRFSKKLSALCEATKERGDDYYQGKIG